MMADSHGLHHPPDVVAYETVYDAMEDLNWRSSCRFVVRSAARRRRRGPQRIDGPEDRNAREINPHNFAHNVWRCRPAHPSVRPCPGQPVCGRRGGPLALQAGPPHSLCERVVSRRQEALSVMGWLWRSAPSKEQSDVLRRRCSTRVSALSVCRAANSATACDTFALDCDLCSATVLCAKQAEAFMACSTAAAAATAVTTGRECAAEAKAMRACLSGFKLPVGK
jgi:hypothetical protein